MTTEEKVATIGRSDEVKKAVGILIALFRDCELKTHIRYTFEDEDTGEEFEFTLLALGAKKIQKLPKSTIGPLMENLKKKS